MSALADGEISSGNQRIILNIKHRQTFRDNYIHPFLSS
ncbi:Fic family protein [Methanolacinia paynteri]